MAQAITRSWNKNLLIAISILTLWGFINFYSISTPLSIKNYNNQYRYLIEFFIKNVVLASAAFLFFSLLSWKTLKRISLPLCLIFFALVLLAFAPGLKPAGQSTARWINLGVFSFQPTEFLKLALLLWLSFFTPRLQKEFKSPYERSIILILIIVAISTFILLQPALSNLLIIWLSIGAGYLSLKPKAKELVPFVLIIIIFLALSLVRDYRIQRIIAYLKKDSIQSENYQKTQTTLAIGSGGFLGKGIGNSKVKLIGLPLITSDSIFAVFSEEAGFIGSIALILVFIALILFVIGSALTIKNPEKKFFAYGVATWISIQACIHIASNMGIIPTTGVPLPFFSSGLSSQLSLMAALGIINNLKNS